MDVDTHLGDQAVSLLAFLADGGRAGRLPGSAGARSAAACIERRLKRLGLSTFRQAVPLTAGSFAAPPSITVGDVSLRYRHDFIEVRAAPSAAGEAAGPLHLISSDTPRIPPGTVLLLPDPPPHLDLAATAQAAQLNGARAFLVAGGDGPFLGKGGGAWRPGAGVPVARLTSGAARILGQHDAVRATISLPYRVRDVTGENVAGLLRPAPRRPTLLLMAHYDHVGDDPGWPYPGAIDNASGVALILACLPSILRAWPPGMGLIALFTTGEEMGLRGARAYAAHPVVPLRSTSVINVDTVGVDPAAHGVAIGSAQTGGRLGKLVARALERMGVQPVWLDLPTDRRALAQRSREAVDISEAHQVRFVHRPADSLERASRQALVILGTALVSAALEFAHGRPA